METKNFPKLIKKVYNKTSAKIELPFFGKKENCRWVDYILINSINEHENNFVISFFDDDDNTIIISSGVYCTNKDIEERYFKITENEFFDAYERAKKLIDSKINNFKINNL